MNFSIFDLFERFFAGARKNDGARPQYYISIEGRWFFRRGGPHYNRHEIDCDCQFTHEITEAVGDRVLPNEFLSTFSQE